MKKVLVFGTFDIIHAGHIAFFKQAREAAGPDSKLVAVVARDVNVRKAKGEPVNDENARLAGLQKVDLVDEAVLGSEDIDFSIIETIKPDMIAIGYDQILPPGFDDYIKDKDIKVIRLKPYRQEKFKSSIIRNNHLK